ncbi:MAG: Verru_Chthon cassette protein B [Verrucomicrobiales bacterium]
MQTRQPRPSRAFSLVEVTIAMAIAAIAVVTLLGLIPQGMETMREAGDKAIIGRIHQQLLNELQMTPFEDETGGSLLDEYDDMEVYYDAQGEELGFAKGGGSDIEGSFEHIYTARITIGASKAPESVGAGDYEGFTFGGNEVNPYVKPVIIEVAPVSGLGENFDWSSEETRSLISTYQSIVVKMGQDFTNEN